MVFCAMYSAPAHTLIQCRVQGRHPVLAAFLIGWRKSAVRKRRHQGKRICKQDFSDQGGTIILTGSSCKDCLRWNTCSAVFLPSFPHNGMRVHVSLTMASHRKNGPTWYAVSLNSTNPYARLPLITACPTKPSDGSFVLFATTEQDKPLSFLCLSLRTLV